MKRELKTLLKSKGYKNAPYVLFAASECAPLSKTGGLADVVGTLPIKLCEQGLVAHAITPCHRSVKQNYGELLETVATFDINVGWRNQYVGLLKLTLDEQVYYLIDNEYYFGDALYKGDDDLGEQYAFFCLAVLAALPHLDMRPDILHCNDWHTAMIPMLLKTDSRYSEYSDIKSILTIHNIAFQGRYGYNFFRDMFGTDEQYFTPEYLEHYGCASFLKAGCVFADLVTTVSPTYSEEICSTEFGEKLEGILSARKNELHGIINGIDTKLYNPYTDKSLPARFHKGRLSGKVTCKKALAERCGLNISPETPLIGMVSRISWQKGLDIIREAFDDLMATGAALVILGTGEKHHEEFLSEAVSRYEDRLSVTLAYDDELSRLIYAGSDLFLMPSLFEPCGISQMIAMRYGTLPIVRSVGGLRDTVDAYSAENALSANGFAFDNFSAAELSDCLKLAVDLYREEPTVFSKMIVNAMERNFDFSASAETYTKLYIDLL